MLYVVKRDGREVPFDSVKIANAIKKACHETGEKLRESEVLSIVQKTINYIEKEKNINITVEEIQNIVERALVDMGYENIKIV